MRIAAMENFPINVAYRHAEVSSRVRRGGVTSIVVRLRTDDGRLGWGEACVGADAASIDAALQAMRPFVLGRSPWHGEAIARDVYHTGLWDYRVQTGNFAFAGIDMALWDLCGQDAGQPLHHLFGGPVQDEIDYFYYLAQGTPDALRAQCADGIARGYRCYYLKVGIDALAEEAMLEAVRAAVGSQARIRIDANEAWSVPEAVHLLERWHGRFGIDFAEAPVTIFPLDRMRDLRARTAVALCANEGMGSAAEAYQVIASGVADIVCFSSYWVGTLRRFHTLASLANLLGIGVCKHTHGELGIAATAAHQLMLTLPNATLGAQQTAAIMADDLLVTPVPIASGPRWGVPDRPGLGIEVDEAKLERFADDYRRHGQFLPYVA